MIKVDLHMHAGEDPEDGLRYPATALVDKAVELGFAAIAVTLHSKVLDDERVFDYARRKGLLLIRAAEWNLERVDVLLYNVTPAETEKIRTFADLAAFKKQRGDDLLIVAPHPYYPIGHSLKGKLEQYIELFDAIEYSMVHLSWLNPSKRAEQVAKKHRKPLVANSDAHNVWMFGEHYTLLDAEPTMPSIFRAIRENRLEWHSPHISFWDCLRMFVFEPMFLRRYGQLVNSFPPPTQSS